MVYIDHIYLSNHSLSTLSLKYRRHIVFIFHGSNNVTVSLYYQAVIVSQRMVK